MAEGKTPRANRTSIIDKKTQDPNHDVKKIDQGTIPTAKRKKEPEGNFFSELEEDQAIWDSWDRHTQRR